MRIVAHREFKKRFKKLRSGEKRRFRERRDLFLENEFHPLLENHPLEGKYKGYRSIHIGGDPERGVPKDWTRYCGFCKDWHPQRALLLSCRRIL